MLFPFWWPRPLQTALETLKTNVETVQTTSAAEMAEMRSQRDAAQAQAAADRTALDAALVEASEARVAATEASAEAHRLQQEIERETRRAREREAESDATIEQLRAKARRAERGLFSLFSNPSRTAPRGMARSSSVWSLFPPPAPRLQLQKERKNSKELERIADEASAERRKMMLDCEDRLEARLRSLIHSFARIPPASALVSDRHP